MSARAPAPAGALLSWEPGRRRDRRGSMRFVWCVLVALLLHQPLMASSLFSWMRFLFREQAADLEPPPDQEVLLSVELDDGLFGHPATGAAPPETPPPSQAGGEPADGAVLLLDGGVPEPAEPDDPSDAKDDDDRDADDDAPVADAGAPPATDPLDAGAPDAATEPSTDPLDAGAPDAATEPSTDPLDAGAPPPDAAADPVAPDAATDPPLADAGPALPPPDAGPIASPLPTGSAAPAATPPDAGVEDIYDLPPLDAGPPADAGPPIGVPVKDPRVLAGGAQAIRSAHSNVRIYIAADVLRRHPLAPMFGGLLNAVPEWKQLLGGTSVDPIRDFDHLLITGPQMRDPRWIVATMDYNIPTAKMRAAVDEVVKRSGADGRWLPPDAHPVPVAVIGRKGHRRVALVEQHKLLVVLPESAEKQISKLAEAKPFRKNKKEGIILYIKRPARALRGFPMPKTVKWMRLRLGLRGPRDFVVNIDAQDASPEDAAKTVKLMERELEALRPVPLSGFITRQKYFFGKPTLRTEGKMIRATAVVTADQVERVMGLVETWLEMRDGDGAKGK